MDKPGWSKSSPGLVEVFEAVFPGPPAIARQMFGYPAGFVNGNMFMGLHQENMVLRLPDGPRAELLAMVKKEIPSSEPSSRKLAGSRSTASLAEVRLRPVTNVAPTEGVTVKPVLPS